MSASSPASRARRWMAAMRPGRARRLGPVAGGAPPARRRCADVAPGPVPLARRPDRASPIPARARRVGMASEVGQLAQALGSAGASPAHGASQTSSSRVARHCRVRAWAHQQRLRLGRAGQVRVQGLGGSAPARPAGVVPPGARSGGGGSRRVERLPEFDQGRRGGVARRRLQRYPGCRSSRPASAAPGSGDPAGRAAPGAASAGGPPGCRCPRWRRSAAAGVAATGCRTSCRSGPGDAPGRPWCPGCWRCARAVARRGM